MSDATATSRRSEELLANLSLRRVGLYAVLLGMIVFYLTPIVSGFITSFKTIQAVGATAPYMPPTGEQFTTEKWSTAFDILGQGMRNSLILAVPATALSAVIGSLAAYGLTNVDWRGQVPIYALFLAGIFIPYQSVLVPLRRFWRSWFPIGDVLAYFVGPVTPSEGRLLPLIITHVAYGIPICTLLFRSYYKDLSDEMVEAARLDGATIPRIYWKIILPLSIPMFAVTLIYQFTQIWNDLLFALIIVETGSGVPVTVDLAAIGAALERTDYPLRMAGALLTALPTLIVYVIFGEQFAKGVAT